MLELVPFLPFDQVLQPEVGGEVDDAHAGLEQAVGITHGHAVRGGKKHHVAFFQRSTGGVRKRQVDMAAQRREHGINTRARLLARGDGAQLRMRMLAKDAQQFHAGVTGAPDDADLDGHVVTVS